MYGKLRLDRKISFRYLGGCVYHVVEPGDMTTHPKTLVLVIMGITIL